MKNARAKRKCKRKVKYKSKEFAIRALNLHVRKYQPTRRVNAYQCKFCKGWHIGHNRVVRLQ